MMRLTAVSVALGVLMVAGLMAAATDNPAAAPASTVSKAAPAEKAPPRQWKNSPIGDPNFFPLSVWCQHPDAKTIEAYKAIGINIYEALWDGPKEEDLAALKKAGLFLICSQTEVALKHLDDPTIIAWLQEDEPDNTRKINEYWKDDMEAVKKAWPQLTEQDLEAAKKWGIGASPSMIVERYNDMRKKDSTRPVVLGVGQGLAYYNYAGRGARAGHVEDYVGYFKGCDIVAFDIYPVNHYKPEVKGKLHYVAIGVDNMIKYGEGKPAFSALECTNFDGGGQPTPEQTRTETWMMIIHGARGIDYFCHVFKPKHISAGLLEDKPMCAQVARTNKLITSLAPVLNSASVKDGATVESSAKDVPIDLMVKKQGDTIYVFSVSMRAGETKGSFTVKGLTGKATVEVLDEDGRKIEAVDGKFVDDFEAGYQAHLYKITTAK